MKSAGVVGTFVWCGWIPKPKVEISGDALELELDSRPMGKSLKNAIELVMILDLES